MALSIWQRTRITAKLMEIANDINSKEECALSIAQHTLYADPMPESVVLSILAITGLRSYLIQINLYDTVKVYDYTDNVFWMLGEMIAEGLLKLSKHPSQTYWKLGDVQIMASFN